MKVLCVGDVVARPGREALTNKLQELKRELQIDLTIVNGENSAGGSGIDSKCLKEIKEAGADVVTLGDHTWRRPEVKSLLKNEENRCVCPGSYPGEEPVKGWTIIECQGKQVGVLNVIGRTFIQSALDCPFRYSEEVFRGPLKECNVRIVDFHGEATSEKVAYAKYFDGKASLIFGTHTHVQTADERILQGGTGYITDIGMTGSQAGVIGMDKDTAIERFLTGRPSSYKPASGEVYINGLVAEIDASSGKTTSIERVSCVVGEG